MTHFERITRRDFLKSSAMGTAAFVSGASADRLLAQTLPPPGVTNVSRRLVADWEYCRGSLGGPWDVWRTDKAANITWQAVPMPHCFEAREIIDPDQPHYQGPGWY